MSHNTQNSSSDQVSSREANEALDTIASSQQKIIANHQAPLLLTLAVSISYASIIFGYGMTEHGNSWALAMVIGGIAFAISASLSFYTYRIMGIKQSIVPRSFKSLMFNLVAGVSFALLMIAAREIRVLGFAYAPHIFSSLAGILMFVLQKKYPLGEYVKAEGNE